MSNFTRVLYAVLIVTTLNGCIFKKDAGTGEIVVSEESGSSASSGKSFFSSWSKNSGLININLSGANQGGSPFSVNYTFADNSYCTCSLTITLTSGSGNVSSGTVASTCGTPVPSGTGQADAFCPTFTYSGTGSYTHNGSSLSVCRPNGGACMDYQ